MDDMDAIYRSHAQTVYKFLLAQCRDPDLAEELTQETFPSGCARSPSISGISICESARRKPSRWRPRRKRRSPQRRTACWTRRAG